MEKICLVYITASNRDEAMKIGRQIVSIKLAACANIFEGMTSFYRWEGKEEESSEAVLILKTREALLPALEKTVKDIHSYSCPCIIALPVVHASKEYEEWILRETRNA